MQIGVLGVNFKTSSLSNRESLAIKIDQLKYEETFCNCVVLSTCNRWEVYFSIKDLAEKQSCLIEQILKHIDLDIGQEFYTFFGFECFHHLAKVTAGLDSAIFGESEIQRQVKNAYEEAKKRFNLTKELHYLFQKALNIGKYIRSIGIEQAHHASLESTIYKLIQKEQKQDQFISCLVIGNSQINRRIIRFFAKRKNLHITLCSKNRPDLKWLGINDIEYLPRESLKDISPYSVVVTATNEKQHVITCKSIKESDKAHLFFDLGLPRNIAPEVRSFSTVKLFDLEELQSYIRANENISFLMKKRFENTVFESVEKLYKKYTVNRKIETIPLCCAYIHG